MTVEGSHCLALHLAGKFLTDRTRRQLDIAGGVMQLARILLADTYSQALSRAQNCAAALRGCSLVSWGDPDYPRLLGEIDHAPFALFLKGNRSILGDPLVSIVGTREPSDTGRRLAALLAAHHAARGKTVVSGIARGVDSIAHHAALHAGGRTIAVLPNGFDHAYPLENRDLYTAAADSEHLLLVSEYPPAQKPQKHHFVRRNRLIAGLSALTVFVEGGLESGGMITVNHALKEGRDVAAFSHPSLGRNAGGDRLCADGAIDLTPEFLPA